MEITGMRLIDSPCWSRLLPYKQSEHMLCLAMWVRHIQIACHHLGLSGSGILRARSVKQEISEQESATLCRCEAHARCASGCACAGTAQASGELSARLRPVPIAETWVDSGLPFLATVSLDAVGEATEGKRVLRKKFFVSPVVILLFPRITPTPRERKGRVDDVRLVLLVITPRALSESVPITSCEGETTLLLEQ